MEEETGTPEPPKRRRWPYFAALFCLAVSVSGCVDSCLTYQTYQGRLGPNRLAVPVDWVDVAIPGLIWFAVGLVFCVLALRRLNPVSAETAKPADKEHPDGCP